jgi:HAMP domain-containing protein
VATPIGERLVGNIEALPPGALDRPGESEIEYARSSDGVDRPSRAIVRVFMLPAGFRLLVGRDVEERERLGIVIRRAAGWSLALVFVLGCFASWFVARRVLKRIDDMTDTAQSIMAGDLKGRLAISGTGDELDRLALNLNAMLDRIGELMEGMQQVSDNIAHDLKTPLTRLRNRAEEALRTAKSPDELRAALDGSIDEADNLIRVFNALLMIARLETGRIQDSMDTLDLSEIVSGLAELYEPLAEEAGSRFGDRSVAPDLQVSRQSRTDRPGAGQSDRQRPEIWQPTEGGEAIVRVGKAHRRGDRALGRRSRPGHPREPIAAGCWSASSGSTRAAASRASAWACRWPPAWCACMAASSGSKTTRRACAWSSPCRQIEAKPVDMTGTAACRPRQRNPTLLAVESV